MKVDVYVDPSTLLGRWQALRDRKGEVHWAFWFEDYLLGSIDPKVIELIRAENE